MPVADDGPRASRRMHHTSDMAISVTDEEPPSRMGRRSRAGSAFKAVLALGVLAAAGAAIWQFLNRPAPEASESAAADAHAVVAAPAPPPPPAPAPAPAPKPAPPPAAAQPPPAAEEKTQPPAVEEKHATEEPRPAAEEHRPPEQRRAEERRPAEKGRQGGADPFARARSWQKPDEPVSPGIALPPPSEPKAPEKTEDKTEGTAPTP
jgi:hypothetical protein